MASHHKTPILLGRKDVVLVKSSKPTPSESEVLSFSTIDNDYALEILCRTIYVYKAHEQSNDISSKGNTHDITPICSGQADPACIIKEALSKVLVHYYPLAGKLKRETNGKLQINCNAYGVPFLVATANCQLSSLHYLDGIDVETAKQLFFDFPFDTNDGYHPLVLQVTKFSCGGFAVGMGLSHSVCDGYGAAQFLRALADLASGKTEPSMKPVWERERLVGKPTEGTLQFPVDKSSLATSPYLPTTDIVQECFNVNTENIKRLKTSLMKENGDQFFEESFTTLEVLGAYVWRSRLRALKLDLDAKTLFSLIMGIRGLLNPPLPDGYYGNAFISSNVVLMWKELNELPVSKVVNLTKESKKLSCSNEFIWKSIDNLEKMRQLDIRIDGGGGASMRLTDWRHLGLLEEVNFGWKGSVNIIPVPWNMFCFVNLCLFLPPCTLDPSMKGGVRVLVSPPRAAMAKFKEEMLSSLEMIMVVHKLCFDNGNIGPGNKMSSCIVLLVF